MNRVVRVVIHPMRKNTLVQAVSVLEVSSDSLLGDTTSDSVEVDNSS